MSSHIKILVDRVYILTSLKGNHLQAAVDLYNYHINFDNKQFIEVHSKTELIKALQEIESEIDYKSCPFIHNEAHGFDSGDGLAKRYGIDLSYEEQVYWEEFRII